MYLSSNEILIIGSLSVMLSYLYNYISRKFKIPSVLLLLLTGILLKITAKHFSIQFLFPQSSLELMGTLGLILIVLEASLELKLSKEEMPQIKNAFIASLSILVISIVCIGMILYYWLGASFKKSIINAIPLALVVR
jgi:Kef-type K+ transport system membrane component KefB